MNSQRKLESGEGVFTWVLLIFAVVVLVMAYQISGFSSVSSPGSFPMVAAVIMVSSLVALIVENRKATKPDVTGFVDELRKARQEVFQPTFLIYVAIILLYMILLQPFHFLPSSFLFLLGSIVFLKGSTPVKALIISVLLLLCIYAIFHYLFRVVLP